MKKETDVLHNAIIQFENALQNWIAVKNQIIFDAHLEITPYFDTADVDLEGIGIALDLIEKTFRDVCLVSHWTPRTRFSGGIDEEIKIAKLNYVLRENMRRLGDESEE